MIKSRYIYFFDYNEMYLGYSWLADSYIEFSSEEKERVKNIINNPNDILFNRDAEIYKELCQKMFLISENFDEYVFMLNLNRKMISRKDYLNLIILPTYSCNLRCYYCYEVHKSDANSKMPDEIYDNLYKYITSLNDLKKLNIVWFGGEPLLAYKELTEFQKKIFDHCNTEQIKFTTSIVTNGVLLGAEKSKEISSAGINDLQITIDGPEQEHDNIRVYDKSKPTFNSIINNLIEFLKADEINTVRLRVHYSNNLTFDFVNETFESINSIPPELRSRVFPYLHKLFANCIEDWSTKTPAQKKESNKEEVMNYFNKKIVEQGYSISEKKLERISYYCYADTQWSWVILPSGLVTKCSVALDENSAVGKVTSKGIKLFNNSLYDWRIKEFEAEFISKCKNCDSLPFCWGGCQANIRSYDSYKEYFAENCKKMKSNEGVKRAKDEIVANYLQVKKKCV